MKKLSAFFKNKIVISIIGLIVLSLLIWFVGPEIKFGGNNFAPLGGYVVRLVSIMVIIVLWGLNNLRLALHDKKVNEGLVNDLQHNQSDKDNSISDQTSEEMHVIGERFSQAMTTLRKLKFKGGRGRKALYELPWYVIIGPPGSGKTTALINSSLEFPLAEKLGKEALHGVGGTRNCDWWFTNEAVLIDTAGRYTTQDSHKVIDSSSWDGFLGLLKKYRRRRPINGAIVAISLQELLTQTEEERNAHARIIRSRLDELMSKLEIRFPIYLMFTKSDLVSGFSEYFEDLNKEDREQVWGVSLPDSPHASHSPDFDFIQEQYDALVKRLYESAITRVHQERDINRRAAIQSFPQQMENLKEIATSFVQKAFVKNRYEYQPYLRGVYFTSGTQDGTPIDRLMSSVSANFGFSRQGMTSTSIMGKSFFLGKLFRDIIFPESELVGVNRKYEAMLRWAQRAGYVGLTAITASLLIVWTGSFTRNEMYMHQVHAYVSKYKDEQKNINQWSHDLQSVLPSLNALSKASMVYNSESHPWLAGLGMYDSSVDNAADQAYREKLQSLFLPRLLKYMEYHLRRGQQGQNLYDDFRTYMMFSKIKHMDKADITSWFEHHWNREYVGKDSVTSGLLLHLSDLLKLNLKPAKLNTGLVSVIRSELLRVPLAQRIYNRLRTNPEYSTRVDLVTNFGESVRETYSINNSVAQDLHIPVLFTAQVYKSIDLSPDSNLISKLARENWVLSDDSDNNAHLSKDKLKTISEKVKGYYSDEYRSYWLKVYGALSLKPFADIRHADDALLSLVDPVYSPLVSILRVGSANTTLTNQSVQDVAENNKGGVKGKALNFVSSHVKMTSVDKQFRELNQISREYSNHPAQIQNLIQKIKQVQEFVNGIVISPDPGKKAYEVAKIRFQGGTGGAINSLLSYSQTLPEPVNRWMQTLSNETWKVIFRAAHGYVSRAWHNQIYSSCQNALNGKYPFNVNSSDDVAMIDFTEYFKPGGTINKFSDQYIKPFVNVNSGWSNKGVGPYSIGLHKQALAQIKNAFRIRDVFFRKNPTAPTLSFQLRPYKMKKTDERFFLESGSKRISYSHGPKFWSTFKWTGSDDNDGIRLVFEDLDGMQHTENYEGPWAWFKLQNHSRVFRATDSNHYLMTFSVTDEGYNQSGMHDDSKLHSITFEIKPNSIHNPFNQNLFGAYKCTPRI
jgi:type VI secretion system protein ImpL